MHVHNVVIIFQRRTAVCRANKHRPQVGSQLVMPEVRQFRDAADWLVGGPIACHSGRGPFPDATAV